MTVKLCIGKQYPEYHTRPIKSALQWRPCLTLKRIYDILFLPVPHAKIIHSNIIIIISQDKIKYNDVYGKIDVDSTAEENMINKR